MKYCIISIMIGLYCVTVKADDFLNLTFLSYESKSPSGEPVQCFPTEQVKKWKKRKKVQQSTPVVVTKEVPVEKVIEKTIESPNLPNRIRFLMGMGPYYNGYVEQINDKVSLDVKYLPMGGVGYDRSFNKKWNAGISAYTNLSFLLSLGYDF